jgi:hypothetical protein
MAWRWLNRKSAASGRWFDEHTKAEVVSIYRTAGIAAVMSGEVDGLLGSRRPLKAAARAASAEIYRAWGRDGIDRTHDTTDGFAASAEWEMRDDWTGQRPLYQMEGSAIDEPAGSGPRPSAKNSFDDWGTAVRTAFEQRVSAAKTPQARSMAAKSAARNVDLVESLISFAKGGAGPAAEILEDFFPDGQVHMPISGAGHVRLHRLRALLHA